MKQAVIVFSFPEPENSLELGMLIEAAKKPFLDKPDVRIHLAIKDAADEIISMFTNESSESNLVDHARRELERFETDQDYISGILKVIKAFSDMGHSGGSASIAIPTINDLLQFKNLTPLTDDPKEWNNVSDMSGEELWQSSRNPEAFSTDGGKTYYLLSEGGNALKPSPLHESKRHVNDSNLN